MNRPLLNAITAMVIASSGCTQETVWSAKFDRAHSDRPDALVTDLAACNRQAFQASGWSPKDASMQQSGRRKEAKDKQREENYQRALIACMDARGHDISFDYFYQSVEAPALDQ